MLRSYILSGLRETRGGERIRQLVRQINRDPQKTGNFVCAVALVVEGFNGFYQTLESACVELGLVQVRHEEICVGHCVFLYMWYQQKMTINLRQQSVNIK